MPALLRVWDGGDNSDGLTWATAYQNITTAHTNIDADGFIRVASEHQQTVAASLTLESANGTVANPVTIISVDKDNSDAYLAMRDDVAPGKIETTGAGSNMNMDGNDIYIGVTLNVGNDLNFYYAGHPKLMIDCKFSVNDNILIGATSSNYSVIWENCHLEQITVGSFSIDHCPYFIWKGGSYTWNGGAVGSSLFYYNSGGLILRVSDVDFQDLDAGDRLFRASVNAIYDVVFKRCKVPAALGGLIDAIPTIPGNSAKFHSVSNSDIIYQLQENYYEGQVNEDTATYYDATYDGTNGYSVKMVSTVNSKEWTRPLRFKLAEIWASANPTLTVELNTDNVVLQDDEFWIEIEYPDGTTGALGGLDQTSRMTNITDPPANLTTSTAAWTEAFGTEKPQKIEVTIANGQAGIHTIWACLGKPSSTVYVCPKVVVS